MSISRSDMSLRCPDKELSSCNSSTQGTCDDFTVNPIDPAVSTHYLPRR